MRNSDELVVRYIRKKNKLRKIITYQDGSALRQYHERVVDFVSKNTICSTFAKAYLPGASIYKNALAHLYNDVFIKMDIKDFFLSISHKYMAETLYYEINKCTTISRRECYEIVERCSTSNKGLPLGLVSSPILANLYLKEFDGLLYGMLKKLRLDHPIYTRYADDLIISFRYKKDYQKTAQTIENNVADLLRRFSLKVNSQKTQVVCLKDQNHVRITGISITRDADNYRHISVGRKRKCDLFWNAINMYDSETKDDEQIARIKGIYSFVLSVEKKGIDSTFSQGMNQLIQDRGFVSLGELIRAL